MMKIQRRNDVSEVWERHKDSLARSISKIVGDRDAANDLSHEVLLKSYNSCCSGREIRNVRSWIFRIAYNTCIDYFKKGKREIELKQDFPREEDDLTYKRAGEYIEPLIQLYQQTWQSFSKGRSSKTKTERNSQGA